MGFGRLGRHLIEANFEDGALCSDDGLMPLRQVDRKIGLSGTVAPALHDPCAPDPHHSRTAQDGGQRLYGQ